MEVPQYSANRIVRNQIDYCHIQRYQNCNMRVAAYLEADIVSDHNPLIANMSIRLKNIAKVKPARYFNVEKLQKNGV